MGKKGNTAELEVARMLQAWWHAVEPDAIFARTPLSGGWGSPKAREGFRVSGDIMSTASKFPFVVESKRREGWSPQRFVEGRPCPIWKWWVKTQADAAECDAEPIMFMRRNVDTSLPPRERHPVWVIVVREGLILARRRACPGLVPWPDFTWLPDLFDGNGVNVGAHPVAYIADRFLAIEPSVFAIRAP